MRAIHPNEKRSELRRVVDALVRQRLDSEVAAFEAIEPGLGTRSFYRVRLEPGVSGGPESVIARVEAPEDPAMRPHGIPAEPPLEPLRSFLESKGIPVPASFGRDSDAGVDLLEDVGEENLEVAATRLDPDARSALYDEACALVPRLQELRADRPGIAAFERRLDSTLFSYKAEQFIQWCVPWGLGRKASRGEEQVVREAFALISSEAARAPARFAHRDFKAANLHLRPDRSPGERLVLIDLQGAFLAPPEYDLVCLLRDAHVSLTDAEVEQHLLAVRRSLPDAPEADVFARRFTLLTLTRNGKDLARYLYAAREQRDERYLRLLPNAVAALRTASSRAARWDARLARLAELIEELSQRRKIPCGQ